MKRTVIRVSLGAKVAGGVTLTSGGWVIVIPPNVHGEAEREVLIAVDELIERCEAGSPPVTSGMDIVPRRRATDLQAVEQQQHSRTG